MNFTHYIILHRTLHETLDVLDRLENRSCQSYQEGLPGPLRLEDQSNSDRSDTNIESDETRLAIRRCRANADYLLGVIYAWIGKMMIVNNNRPKRTVDDVRISMLKAGSHYDE